MVGGGSRKDEALVINSTNVFAALGSLRKKKKGSDKDGVKGKASASKNSVKQSFDEKPDPQVFWAPAPLNAKSWGDVDDEDDDDYFAITAPPRPAWDDDADGGKAKGSVTLVEESESEEEGLDEVDDEEEHEHEHEQDPEPDAEPEPVIPVAKKPAEVVAPKESERQLSKKELKKKELEELDAMLAEFGLKPEGQGDSQEKKVENLNGEVDKKENVASGESKNAKKKKKKDKTAKDAKEQQEKPNGNEVRNDADETLVTLLSMKEDEAPAVDMKEKLKKVAAAKKKKSSKEMDAAAKAAANEAAARNARLVAAKKKEKNHYNQQPVR